MTFQESYDDRSFAPGQAGWGGLSSTLSQPRFSAADLHI
jgi:hypothetical protein